MLRFEATADRLSTRWKELSGGARALRLPASSVRTGLNSHFKRETVKWLDFTSPHVTKEPIMKNCLLSLVAAGVLVATSGTTWAEQSANAGQQKPAELDRATKVKLKYLIYLPRDYEQKGSWPVLLFLHGSGERGDNLDLVKKHGPPKLIAGGKQFPFIVVSPQCPNGRWWDPMELATLLDEIGEKYKVDQERL